MTNGKRFREKLTNWELWPFGLIYAPLVPLWLWYAAKAKAFWFFTPVNPTLTFAGFDGEGKKEMYDLLPEGSFPKTIYMHPSMPFEVVKEQVSQHGFRYPFCVKPDRGLKGLLFRKVDDEEKLKFYHAQVPAEYLVQELVVAPLEVSVFYYRHPAQPSGTISGFIQKEMMQVVGDGKSTLWELILAHPRAKHRLKEMQIKHKKELTEVIPAGESFLLTHAANLNRGARFTNLEALIDQQLLQVFDVLSHRCSFYYGRYDLKCNSIEELKEGKFSILEFNGTGAEPNHVYNAGYSWFKALSVFAHHWRMMYRIGKYNNRHKGVRYWSNREGYAFLQKARKYTTVLEQADRKILF